MTDDRAEEAVSLDEATLDDALAQAHIPTLMMTLVHLTGDPAHLTPERRPVYDFFGDGQGGLSEADQADVRAQARAAILAHLRDGRPLPAPPSREMVRRLMDFTAGVNIPEHYVPFLMEELGVDGTDAKRPDWSTPALKRAAGRFKVLVIGAGMSGLLAGIRLSQAGVAFEIVDKNADVGGTWLENTYPGCRVDTPNHMYSYSFEANHDWPDHYSTQPVLLDYFRRTAERHDLRRHIRFETTVTEAVFDEARAKWRVTLRDASGATSTVEADAVISAVGQLNQPHLPEIPGRDSFEGPAFHSARWRHDVELTGKRVGVIGAGASAFQFVPEIAPKVAELEVFQRTPPWLGPTANYHEAVAAGKQWLIQHVPFYDKWYRFWLFWMMTDGVYEAVKADPEWTGGPGAVSPLSAQLRGMLIEKIREQLQDKMTLLEHVVPAYPFGGKRSLRDNGVWLRALQRPNVRLVTNGIDEITERGVVTEDGVEHPLDVLIYGTGFHASRFLWPMRIVGRGGVELHQRWNDDARAYLGMTVPGFPNFFMIYGPNTNIVVNGSIIFFSECSVRYVVGCLQLLAERGDDTLEVREAVHDTFNREVDEANTKMAWGAPQVSSWYKNATGRVSQNWPFPLVDYWSATIRPNANDFTFGQAAVHTAPYVAGPVVAAAG